MQISHIVTSVVYSTLGYEAYLCENHSLCRSQTNHVFELWQEAEKSNSTCEGPAQRRFETRTFTLTKQLDYYVTISSDKFRDASRKKLRSHCFSS